MGGYRMQIRNESTAILMAQCGEAMVMWTLRLLPYWISKPIPDSTLKYCLLRTGQLPPLCSPVVTSSSGSRSSLARLPFCIPLLVYAELGHPLFLDPLQQNVMSINLYPNFPVTCQADIGPVLWALLSIRSGDIWHWLILSLHACSSPCCIRMLWLNLLLGICPISSDESARLDGLLVIQSGSWLDEHALGI